MDEKSKTKLINNVYVKIREFLNNKIQDAKDKKHSTIEFLDEYGKYVEHIIFLILSNVLPRPGKLLNLTNQFIPRQIKFLIQREKKYFQSLGLKNVKLLGGHFRGLSTMEGRRTALIMDRDSYTQLNLDDKFYDLFDKVFLKEYFKLFLRKNTLNELWIERVRAIQVNSTSVLEIKFEWDNNASKSSRIVVRDGSMIIPKVLCDLLITSNLFATYVNLIVEKIKCYSKQITANKDNNKFVEEISNAILFDERTKNFKKLLESRMLITIDEYINNRYEESNILVKLFFPNSNDIEKEILLNQIISALQAMLLYCYLSRTEYFYSLPYIKKRTDDRIESASLTIMSTQKIEEKIIKEILMFNDILFKPIIENTDDLKIIFEGRLDADIELRSGEDSLLRHQISDIIEDIIPSSSKDAKPSDIHENEEKGKNKNIKKLLKELCILGSKLKNKKHEGFNLQFSFILGQVDAIGNQFKVLHSLGNEIIRDLDLLKSFNLAKSIINGNFAFLQRDNIALFAPYPRGELVFTHIVDLEQYPIGEEIYFDQRQKWLSSASRGKDTYVVATFREGIAALYKESKLVARTSQFGQEWEKYEASQYSEYFDITLPKTINDCCRIDYKNKIASKLSQVIKAISEAPNKGALFVLCDLDKVINSERVRHMTKVFDIVEGKTLDRIDMQQLYELATQDGATLIDIKTRRISGRWQLPTINPIKYKVSREQSVEDYLKSSNSNSNFNENFLNKTLEWGSRHLSAWAITLGDIKQKLNKQEKVNDAFNATAICISADGPVQIFREGKILVPWPQN